MEGGCHTAYTDNHYNSDLFSVKCEEFYYSVLTCLNMKHMYCHTPPIHIEYWDRQNTLTKPRDAKQCQKFPQLEVITSSSQVGNPVFIVINFLIQITSTYIS